MVLKTIPKSKKSMLACYDFAKKANYAKLKELLVKILEAPDVLLFGKFLKLRNVSRLRTGSSEDQRIRNTLQLFADGTVSGYFKEREKYLNLNQKMLKKLQFLTLVTLGRRAAVWSIAALREELHTKSIRETLDVIIDAIEADVVHVKMSLTTNSITFEGTCARDEDLAVWPKVTMGVMSNAPGVVSRKFLPTPKLEKFDFENNGRAPINSRKVLEKIFVENENSAVEASNEVSPLSIRKQQQQQKHPSGGGGNVGRCLSPKSWADVVKSAAPEVSAAKPAAVAPAVVFKRENIKPQMASSQSVRIEPPIEVPHVTPNVKSRCSLQHTTDNAVLSLNLCAKPQSKAWKQRKPTNLTLGVILEAYS